MFNKHYQGVIVLDLIFKGFLSSVLIISVSACGGGGDSFQVIDATEEDLGDETF